MRQMAKKRKRRNKKLFRTMRKTIAAIIMIMAVVVAAIPVEQFGSTEAKTNSRSESTLNLDALYADYAVVNEPNEDDDLAKYDYEKKGADESDATIYSIKYGDSGLEYSADYYVKMDDTYTTEGVIIGYAGTGNQDVTITTDMCTGYFVITTAYINALKEELKDEVYVATFEKASVDDANNQMNYEMKILDTDGVTVKEIRPITLTSLFKTEPVFTTENSAQGTMKLDGVEYAYIAGDDDFDAEVVLRQNGDKYGTGYSTRATAITAYNKELNDLRAKVQQYQNGCTEAQAKDVELAIEDLEKDFDELKRYEKKFTELAEKQDTDFIKDCIKYRFCSDNSTTYHLKEFNIATVTDIREGITQEEEVRYVPICKGTPATSIIQTDADGYVRLTGKTITVTGIASEAFKDEDIRTVTLSEKVDFIGTSAFEGCKNLKQVNLAFCDVVGNKAFKNCTALESVVFQDQEEGAKRTANRVLGAEAFYKCTALKQISFSKSLEKIGRGCFAESGIQKFYFNADATNKITIWPFAFYDCVDLQSVNTQNGFFPSGLTADVVIGLGAFALSDDIMGLSMTEFEFPASMRALITGEPFGLKAFLESATVDDANKTYSEEYGITIGEKPANPETGMIYDAAGEIYNDFILANRYDLQSVTFGANLGKQGGETVKVPDNTLFNCINIEKVTFGEVSYSGACKNVTFDAGGTGVDAKYDTDEDGQFLFQDIQNANFTVYGPGYKGVEQAEPRIATSVSQTVVSNFVPYVYLGGTEDDALPQIELSYGPNGEYVATINVTDEGQKLATLTEFKRIDQGSKEPISLTIPTQVGGYNISKLGEGCFEAIVDYIYEISFEDNAAVELEIAEGVFAGADNLARVYIGNSVKVIAANAFAGCESLENVYFTNPILTGDDWSEVIQIDETAFRTNSEYLTFHGEIHEGYRPFELAMSGVDFNDTEQMNICYKTGAPSNLTVIRDNATGAATLIDYPHYEEIDIMNPELVTKLAAQVNTDANSYSIIRKFELKHGFAEADRDTDIIYENFGVTDEEGAVVLNTLMLDIPKGVDSIDAKSYFQNQAGSHDNSPNFAYLTLGYEEIDGKGPVRKTLIREVNATSTGKSNIVSLYSNDNYASVKKSAGLFSGSFTETNLAMINKDVWFEFDLSSGFNKRQYVEQVSEGNDMLTSINLGSVQSIPDYAFSSCENLLSVEIGPELTTMGKAPFSGCTNLTGIEAADNSYFHSRNGIIYQLTSDSDVATLSVIDKTSRPDTYYTIVQCLQIRGTEVAYPSSVSPNNDYELSDDAGIPVGAIAEEAFAYCKDIEKVDLSETYVTEIPEKCFMGASSLKAVILPYTTTSIAKGAFSETNADVYITNPACNISEAFDSDYKGTIYSYKYKEGSTTEYSTVYSFYEANKNKMNIQFEEIGHMLTFVYNSDDGEKILETQTVPAGESGSRPIVTPTREDYEFIDWAWSYEDENGNTVTVTGEQAYQNVQENRVIYAVFEPTGIIYNGQPYQLNISKGTEYTSGSNTVEINSGEKVMVVADESATDEVFQYWSATITDEEGNVTDASSYISDIHNKTTYITMPNGNVELTANYAKVITGDAGSDSDSDSGSDSSSGSGSGSGSDSGSGSGNNSGTTDTVKKYTLTVNYGSGGGTYEAGKTVTITANDMGNSRFSKWTTTTSGVGFVNTYASTTTITMPASDVTVTANFKAASSLEFDDEDEDDDDDSTSNRRPVGGSTGTSSNVTVTDKTTGTTQVNGDIISVNKNDISNKNVASTKVEGATDNFVVKVTDTDNSRILAEAALRDAYGSLEGIVYSPMDISLYDATGKNPILDSEGLDVTVTLPIPDDMIQYGGNVRVAAVDNGKLETLSVRFTTIDGIACVAFVPPHFSPYVIYVNTNNLVAGQITDATPETGDFIHPKWFIALGMACLSIFLFTAGDRRKKMNFA